LNMIEAIEAHKGAFSCLRHPADGLCRLRDVGYSLA
jgi:hypothetical protein